jgi:hypothetical protein
MICKIFKIDLLDFQGFNSLSFHTPILFEYTQKPQSIACYADFVQSIKKQFYTYSLSFGEGWGEVTIQQFSHD